jgi:hypothetical protein
MTYEDTVRAALLTDDSQVCRCWPHGPDDPCLCDGRYASGASGCCAGHEPGCCCDIGWDCEHDAGQRAAGAKFWAELKEGSP